MSRYATLIGRHGEKTTHIACGTASEMRDKFKHGSFAGFTRVWYLDTSGTAKRKKGAPAPKPAARPAKK